MQYFSIRFADSAVSIASSDDLTTEFLSHLFGDLATDDRDSKGAITLSLSRSSDRNHFVLADTDRIIHRGALDVEFAARLYDIVIFHLLNKADGGVALHAGAVVRNDRVILLPGISGSGKSSLTAWLTAQGCSYLSDELIFISAGDPPRLSYFNRPVCLKNGSLPLLPQLIADPRDPAILSDHNGALLPHRLLNPEFNPQSSPPDIILFPHFEVDSPNRIEAISTARTTTLLMGCHVNARNLEHHGFELIVKLAASTTAFRLHYSSFRDSGSSLVDILAPVIPW